MLIEFLIAHLTTGYLRYMIGVCHLNNIVVMCLKMDAEGRMCFDNLYQSTFHSIAISSCGECQFEGNVIGGVERMLHALIVDAHLSVT